MNEEFYTEDQLQNLELQQMSDELDKAGEKLLTALDKFIGDYKHNVQFVHDKINSIIYDLQNS